MHQYLVFVCRIINNNFAFATNQPLFTKLANFVPTFHAFAVNVSIPESAGSWGSGAPETSLR